MNKNINVKLIKNGINEFKQSVNKGKTLEFAGLERIKPYELAYHLTENDGTKGSDGGFYYIENKEKLKNLIESNLILIDVITDISFIANNFNLGKHLKDLGIESGNQQNQETETEEIEKTEGMKELEKELLGLDGDFWYNSGCNIREMSNFYKHIKISTNSKLITKNQEETVIEMQFKPYYKGEKLFFPGFTDNLIVSGVRIKEKYFENLRKLFFKSDKYHFEKKNNYYYVINKEGKYKFFFKLMQAEKMWDKEISKLEKRGL